MVYAHAVNRITLSGTMFGGAEEWSTGFFFGAENADAADGSDEMAAAILAAWTTFFENATSHINANYITTQCKVAKIAATGFTELDKVFYAYPGAEVNGGVGTGTLPAQCSLVVSLLSDRPRGLASKGRMYLPGISAIITSTGKISTTNRDTIATNIQTFFDALTGHMDIPDQLILAAKGTGVTPALTAQNDWVETIKVGDVVDTQRRRRNNLTESYISKVLA